MNTELGFERVPCPDGSAYCELSVALVNAGWSLSKNGAIVASGESEQKQGELWHTQSIRILGNFHADPGTYVLSLNVREDESRLDSHEPRLVVFENGGKWVSSSALGEYSLLALLLLVPVGTCLIIRAAILHRQARLDAFARGCCLTQPGTSWTAGIEQIQKTTARAATRAPLEAVGRPRLPKGRLSRQWPFSRTSWFGLIGATTYLLVFIPISVSQSLDHVTSSGFRVHLLRPEVRLQSSPGIQPLRVRLALDGRNVRPSLFVDSQLVVRDDLGAVLQKELSRRPPDWPVYLEGDPDIEWKDVAKAIDAIRGLQAEVVLLTPRTQSALGLSESRRQVK